MSSLQPSRLPAEAPDTVEEKQALLAVPSLNLYVRPQTGYLKPLHFGEMCGFLEPGEAVFKPSSVNSQLRDALICLNLTFPLCKMGITSISQRCSEEYMPQCV